MSGALSLVVAAAGHTFGGLWDSLGRDSCGFAGGRAAWESPEAANFVSGRRNQCYTMRSPLWVSRAYSWNAIIARNAGGERGRGEAPAPVSHLWWPSPVSFLVNWNVRSRRSEPWRAVQDRRRGGM